MYFDSPTEGYGLIPALFAKTNLFAPLPRGQRTNHQNIVLPVQDSQQSFRFTGTQLDETDREVLMGLIQLSGKRPYGEQFTFTRYRLFQVLKQTDNLNVGKTDYERLDISLTRLAEARIALDKDIKRPTAMRSILTLTSIDDGHLTCTFNICLSDIFNECIAINLNERRVCKTALAKSLHILLNCSSASNELYALSWLAKRHGQCSPLFKVRERIEHACEALVRAKVITSFEWLNKSKKGCFLSIKRNWEPNTLAVPPTPKKSVKEKPMLLQGTLVFAESTTSAFFTPTAPAQQSVFFSSDDKRDVAIEIRGSTYRPFIKDHTKIIINPFLKAVDNDLVLVRGHGSYAIGFAEFDENGKLTLKYPGHKDLEWKVSELVQIVKIQGVVY